MANRYFKCCKHSYKSVNDRAKNDATRAHIGCQECPHAGCTTGYEDFMPSPVNANDPLVDNFVLIFTATVRESAGLRQDFVKGQMYDSQVMTEYNQTLIINGNQSLAPAPSYLSSGSTHASTVSVSQQFGSTSYGQGRALPRPVSYSAAVSGLTALSSQVRREEPEDGDEDEDNESRYRPVIPRQRKKRHE